MLGLQRRNSTLVTIFSCVNSIIHRPVLNIKYQYTNIKWQHMKNVNKQYHVQCMRVVLHWIVAVCGILQRRWLAYRRCSGTKTALAVELSRSVRQPSSIIFQTHTNMVYRTRLYLYFHVTFDFIDIQKFGWLWFAVTSLLCNYVNY